MREKNTDFWKEKARTKRGKTRWNCQMVQVIGFFIRIVADFSGLYKNMFVETSQMQTLYFNDVYSFLTEYK